MRILHTSDWHLGRTLEGRNRADEQAQFVDELCQIAKDEAIQLILVAGDVFDTVNPPAAAEELFYDAMNRLSDRGQRPVLVIAGNHDNPDRLCAATPLASRQGILLTGLPGETPSLGHHAVKNAGPGWCEVAVGNESAIIATLPYPSETRLNELLTDRMDDESHMRQAYSDRIAFALAQAATHFRPDAVRLVISHLFAAGGKETESERPIQVGGAFTVHPSAFPTGAQYVALGHLHRPQTMTEQPTLMRYSGSPLAYSFSEAGQVKSVTWVDATPTHVAWREVPLSSGRPLVRWKAPYGMSQVEQWCNDGRDSNAWVELEIHLDAPLTMEEVGRLKRMHRGLVTVRPVFAAQAQTAVTVEERQNLPVEELFRLFYANRRGGAEPAPDVIKLFLELLDKASGEAVPAESEGSELPE